jgi:hypothetical protein
MNLFGAESAGIEAMFEGVAVHPFRCVKGGPAGRRLCFFR